MRPEELRHVGGKDEHPHDPNGPVFIRDIALVYTEAMGRLKMIAWSAEEMFGDDD